MARREFTRNQKEQIVERARNAEGMVACERCGMFLKKGAWEIDHIIPEALRPEADRKAKITIAEGQLLGKECCHRGADGKTNKDVSQIARAKRQYNKANGIKAQKQPIRSPGFPATEKSAKRQPKPSLPPRQLYRTIDPQEGRR
ncbi:HNH endonuclease [Rhizobium sp. P32RR-XVIII]|uniref:HNH endonuclease signature motif containing protein n=1 Tax=Rhizobium sp. P32RR-XVIII TaxID=2726738 RepID=UPI001456FDAF|nr:HNH endonuclease signature motif containing protein [Rhizobium sp. P32RR-XVIII]NLS03572.1 HNH endonuclease [Rhizobium sp. P32RR-XVIII]